MRLNVRPDKRYFCITYSSCTVVVDNNGNEVISCPTEDEAVEYIRNLEKEMKYDESV